jgi:hypothetical protein
MLRGRAHLRGWILTVALLGTIWLLPGLAGAETLTLTPANAFNPIGTDHALTGTIDPATQGAKVFFQVGGLCSGGTDDGEPCFPADTACAVGGGTCEGPDQGTEFDCTTSDAGTCENGYPNTEGLGVNTIRGCALLKNDIGAVADYDACAADPNGILSAGDPAVKTWLAPFVTGGWTRGKGKTAAKGDGEIRVGPSGAITGRYHLHGNGVDCRLDTFTSMAIECTTGATPCLPKPPTSVNKITVDVEGTCKSCGAIQGTLVLIDNGKPGKADRVQWTTSAAGQCQPADVPDLPEGTISGGKITVHEGPHK